MIWWFRALLSWNTKSAYLPLPQLLYPSAVESKSEKKVLKLSVVLKKHNVRAYERDLLILIEYYVRFTVFDDYAMSVIAPNINSALIVRITLRSFDSLYHLIYFYVSSGRRLHSLDDNFRKELRTAAGLENQILIYDRGKAAEFISFLSVLLNWFLFLICVSIFV